MGLGTGIELGEVFDSEFEIADRRPSFAMVSRAIAIIDADEIGTGAFDV